jgi:hypothetical protein
MVHALCGPVCARERTRWKGNPEGDRTKRPLGDNRLLPERIHCAETCELLAPLAVGWFSRLRALRGSGCKGPAKTFGPRRLDYRPVSEASGVKAHTVRA